MADTDEHQFSESFIKPFWLLAHLDKAMGVSTHVANAYIAELKVRGQLPSHLQDYEDAAQYLSDLTTNVQFRFRCAPIQQFAMEEEWLTMNDLPKFESNKGKTTRISERDWQ